MGICASTQISGRALVGEDEGSDAPARPRSAKSFFFLLGKTESDAEEPTEEDLLAGDANDAPIKFKTGTSFFYQAFGGRADRSSFKKPPPQPEETKVEVDIDRKKERAAPIASGMDAEDNFGRVVGTSLDGKNFCAISSAKARVVPQRLFSEAWTLVHSPILFALM